MSDEKQEEVILAQEPAPDTVILADEHGNEFECAIVDDFTHNYGGNDNRYVVVVDVNKLEADDVEGILVKVVNDQQSQEDILAEIEDEAEFAVIANVWNDRVAAEIGPGDDTAVLANGIGPGTSDESSIN